MDNDLTDALRTVPILANVGEEMIAQLAARCRRARFPQGHVLCREGEIGQAAYIILSGNVRIARTGAGDTPMHVAVRGPGDSIGEMSLIDGLPRSADAVVVDPCDVVVLDRADFLECLEHSPKVLLSVLKCVATRLQEAESLQHALPAPGAADYASQILSEEARTKRR